MKNGIIYRTYRKEDYLQCRQICNNTWPILGSVCPERDQEKLMSAYFEMALLESGWNSIALLNGKVVGMLFGRINNVETWSDRIKKWVGYIRLIAGILYGRYGRIRHPRKFLGHLLNHEKTVKTHSPESDGEVVFFLVDPSARGLGIGRALMDQFIAYAAKKSANLIHLFTDEICSWKFYEHYGFSRHREFADELTTFLTGEKIKGFIYILRIPALKGVAFYEKKRG